jgi:radical SAM protein with 4Fe4S-binding SPASM domain
MCCPDIEEKINLGNIWDVKSLSEIFNSKKAIRIREKLKDGSAFKMDPCKNCSSYESYKGYKGQWGS